MEQTGTNSGAVDLFNVTLGGNGAADTFAASSPASIAVTNSTNEGKPDIDNPLNMVFDTSGDVLIGNGGTTVGSPPDYGSLACIPASAISTTQNLSTTVSTNVNDPEGIAYDSRDGSVALANNPSSASIQLSEYLPTGGIYAVAPASRNLAVPGLGSHFVVNLPTQSAGTYAIALTNGLEVDPAHTGNGTGSKIAMLSPTGVETDILPSGTGTYCGQPASPVGNCAVPATYGIDAPWGLAWDGQNNQLVISNNSTWHRLVTFYTISPSITQVQAINTGGRNTLVAASPDGHIAVVSLSPAGSGFPRVIVYDNTAARNRVGAPIPFNGTTTQCGSTYIYGSGVAVNSLTWLSNTKLLVALQAFSGGNPTSFNGLYIFDISTLATPAGFDDGSGCSAFSPSAKQTGFVHINNKPLGTAFKPLGTFAAGVGASCGSNPQCYTSFNSAIANAAPGGVVNILGGTFNESVNLNNNVVVNLNADTTVNDFAISTGTLNGAGGSCGQTSGGNLTLTTGNFTSTGGTFNPGSGTVTLKAGNWVNNGGTYYPGSGTVAFTGSAPQSVGGTNQTTFGNVTINNAAGVTLNSATTVNSTLTLTNGALHNGANLTFGTGASIVRNNSGAPGGSLGSAPTFGTTVNLTYTGSVAMTSGPEIPAASTVLNNLTINDASGVTLGGNASVNGAFTLTSGNVTTGLTNVLALSASATKSRTSGYIIGNEKKTYSANGSFTYDVGTANGYSPVDVTTTAGTGDLTVVAVQLAEPSVVSNRSLQRYWTLTKGGAGVTANLVFHYLDPTDIMGNESNYQVLQVTGGVRTYYTNSCPAPCVNGAANTFALNGVTNFSDFTAGEARADLQMSNSAAANVVVGNNLTYTIDLTNAGPDTSTSPTVTDAVPAQTTLVSVTTPVGWTRTDSVPAGGTGTIGFLQK